MTKEEKLALMEIRLVKLEGRPQNTKSHGVVNKLRREIRKLKQELV